MGRRGEPSGARGRARAAGWALALLAGFAATWLPEVGAAQTADGTAETAETSTEEEAPAPLVAIPDDPYDRGTPRRAMVGYLTACREADYERAANYLSLDGIPQGQRAEKGPLFARQLKTVLDRALWVEIDRLSDDPAGQTEDGLPSRKDLVGTIERKSGSTDILLARVAGEDGNRIWKIAPETVRQIPSLYDEFGFGRLGNWLPPVFFESHFLEIQLWQWLGLMMLLVGAFFLSWVIARTMALFVRPMTAATESNLDDQVLAAVIGPLRFLVATLLIYASLPVLALAVPAHEFFGSAAKVGALLAVTWLVLRIIDVLANVIDANLGERGDPGAAALIPLGRKTVKVVIIGIALLASLDSFGFDVTALIAGLGVGGLAVALAAQKTVENLFGGATLIADRPVRVGDFCRFGDKVGTVEEIGMRSTRIRTLDRTVVTVPNAEFSSLQLENFGKRDRMRYAPTLGLLYATTPDQMRYVLVELRRMLYAHPRVLPDPARVRFVKFGAFSLDVEIFAYLDATDFSEYLGIAEDLNLRIMDIVAQSGTGFAFPSSTTYLARDDGPDPERTQKAEEKVREWREQGELYLPGFPQDRIESMAKTLEYPPKGAPRDVTK